MLAIGRLKHEEINSFICLADYETGWSYGRKSKKRISRQLG